VKWLLWVANEKVQIVLNMVLGLVFAVMIPVSLITGLKQSVPFLVFLSLWALVAAHWSGALAAWAAQQVTSTNTEEPEPQPK
jgi:hypothetical protein